MIEFVNRWKITDRGQELIRIRQYICIMKRLTAFVLVFCLTTIMVHGQQKGNSSLVIKTKMGTIEGVFGEGGIRWFKGIPFAAPPVGELRWKEPQPVKSWTGIRKADHFGPRAMQTNIFSDMKFRSDGVSEDCLYLNVWAPGNKGKKSLPVFIYFYGGGFVAGDGSEYRYDGEALAKKGIVTVTVNYRLGVFGFMSHPGLTKESVHHASGNYGLLDQAAALKWVKDNIAAFGGEPNKITIGGESAGSVSVSAQMASPLSRNLIAGAIGESGSILGALPAIPLEEGEKTGVEFGKFLGTSSIADMRNIGADSILSASARFGLFRFPRTNDGYFFPKDPLKIYQAGEQAHVPLLVGWNNEESNYKSILGTSKPTKENYIAAVTKLYNSNTDQVIPILKLYNPATDAEVEKVATELAGDRFIVFSTWRWADVQSRTGGKPVYRYLFERPRPGARGAVHSAEIEYALGNLSTNKVYNWTPEDYAISNQLQEYFANFIKYGNPNGAGLPKWESVNPGFPAKVMHINVTSKLETEPHRERYLFLEKQAGR